jgi:Zn-dependent M28 family amino/carboxypeptidase
VNGQEIEAAANAFSPPCDVTAPFIAVGTVAELEVADLERCVGILYGDLTKTPLACKSWFLASEQDLYLVRLLEEKAPAALVTIQPRFGDLERAIADWELSIPSATVNAEMGLALLRGSGSTIHLRIESQRSPGFSRNLVAEKPGDGPARIVLCAHYDTTFDTPGARDNGAGAAVLLTLAQTLSRRERPLGLEWIAFSGHEYLPMGDDVYLSCRGDRLDQIVAVINFDALGATLGANSIMMITHSQPFRDVVDELSKNYPGVVWVDPWPQSNHSTFAWRGVPSIAFSSAGAPRFDHLRGDTIVWVSPAKLAEVVSLVTDIVESLQDKSPAWSRPAE